MSNTPIKFDAPAATSTESSQDTLIPNIIFLEEALEEGVITLKIEQFNSIHVSDPDDQSKSIKLCNIIIHSDESLGSKTTSIVNLSTDIIIVKPVELKEENKSNIRGTDSFNAIKDTDTVDSFIIITKGDTVSISGNATIHLSKIFLTHNSLTYEMEHQLGSSKPGEYEFNVQRIEVAMMEI